MVYYMLDRENMLQLYYIFFLQYNAFFEIDKICIVPQHDYNKLNMFMQMSNTS